MGSVVQGAETSALIPQLDFNARVVYFPVRHHSPACAWHVDRLIREIRPAWVLIEGPRDATPLIPWITDSRLRLPVAIYTTYVRAVGEPQPERHAAYYPLCDFSPELAAIRAAAAVGSTCRFIDLTFPESVEARQATVSAQAGNLLAEHYFKHSRFLRAACQQAGARDSDELWDQLYEDNFRKLDTPALARNVLAYCALARKDHTPEMLREDGCDVREAAMAHEIAAAQAEGEGRIVVVTGGFHTVALPQVTPARPKPVTVKPDDALVVLARYGFEQLDRLNGYASGMPAPEFYQRQWENADAGDLLVELGRSLRARTPGPSTADAIAALQQARGLALMRGHHQLLREDLLDGVRSAFIKGDADTDGVQTMAAARKLLAGHRVGHVPAEVGQPPLVEDFRQTAVQLKIDLDRVDAKEQKLELYRKPAHREISRFFHRLRCLEIPFAHWRQGPDFVVGTQLERLVETWKYRWTPDVESALIEKSLYGASLEEAATAVTLERFANACASGQGGRADGAAQILLDACRMGLHRRAQEILEWTRALIAADSQFVSLVSTVEQLMVLHFSREPLEAHHLTGVLEVAGAAYERACYLIPALAATAEAGEEDTLDAINALRQCIVTLGDSEVWRELRWARLRELAATVDGSAALRGAACGALYSEGQMSPAEMVRALQGHLVSGRNEGAEGAGFLRGLLRVAREVLWQVPELLTAVHAVLRDWEEAHFVQLLPILRLAFADLTPRECDRVGQSVAAATGIDHFRSTLSPTVSAAEALNGAALNLKLAQLLAADGLESFGG